MADFRRNFKDKRGFKVHGPARGNGSARGAKGADESRIVELRIDKMVQGGEGMGRLSDGRVCFVAGALPGELCKVLLTFQKKDFTRGRVLEVVEASPDRVKPKCPLYGRCGGCSLQHLESSKQAEYLAQVERENFKRLAHAELPADFKVHTGNPWNYRNRARVVFCGNREDGARFGFREQESNHAVTFENCPVLTKGLNEFLKGPAKNLKARELNIFDNGNGQVSYYYDGMPAAEFQKNAVSVVEIGGKKIESDASVFFQSNLGLLPELVCAVRNAVDEGIRSGEASDEWLIDLFSGVGFFAALLQDKFKRVTTVERDDGCLKHAKVNLSGNAENVSAPAEDWLAENVVDIPATLIVDPPRTGLPPTALEAIAKSSVKKLIYVSCDPVTLARDFAKLREFGFTMKSAEAFAFYPQTPHMEMLAILSR
ncbi:MAG: TRAM domain-containing protein [Fibrobacter sp.]|nr:TRAM domain-containing protein [Fibrobacter sp.]